MEPRGKVLVADDEADIVYILSRTLKREGFEVVEAYNARECIVKALQEKPDVALIDIMIPELNGWEVCKLIKQHPVTNSVAVALLSVKSLSKKPEYIDEHISKPLELKRVIKVVKNLMDRKVVGNFSPTLS